MISGVSYYFNLGFQGDLDTDVKILGGLDLRSNNGGHCYPSHMDNSLQAILTKIIHVLHKINMISPLETAVLTSTLVVDMTRS